MHNESIEFEFDPAKASSNLAKHSISFSHAEQALRDAFAVTIEDPDAHHFRSQGQQKRNEKLPCVKNTISVKASAAQCYPQRQKPV